ncbi:MAG: hypothetical protein QOK05_179 [Chloroflexota bacterium]|jgi:signal transduction histidine kinase|nr:hypothetical protein [Chloroflexota bacterium]
MNVEATPRPAWAVPAALMIACVGAALMVIHLVVLGTLPASLVDTPGLNRGSILLAIPLSAMLAVPLLLAIKVPGNPVGWLLGLSVLAFSFLAAGSEYVQRFTALHDVPAAFAIPMGLLSIIGWCTSFPLLLVLVPLVFPDGHLLSRRWRPVVWLALFSMTFNAVTSFLDPNIAGGGNSTQPTLIGWLDGPVSSAMTLGLIVSAATSLVIRYRRAGRELRQQLKWFVAAVVFAIVGVALSLFGVTGVISDTLLTLSLVALPIAIVVAVLRYRLYDIDVVISRALVYGTLALFITAIYVGIVVGVGSLVGSGGRPNLVLSIVATAIVAVGFQPVRERVTRLANRLVYGRRATPYEVLSEFSQRVAESYATDEVVTRMARVLCEGTGAESAGVWLRRGSLLAQAATWPESPDPVEPLTVPGEGLPDLDAAGVAVAVTHHGRLLGALTASKRRGETLTPIERKLMEDLAHQAGLVLRNVGLAADLKGRLEDLRRSRQRLVAAQDQERRRLERDLHDGAQQYLVAMKIKIGLARNMARQDPDRTKLAIAALKDDADATLANVRDLARGIYPPLLAEQGLQAALQAQARRAVLPVSVETEGAGRYSEEIESAAYFCVLEALQNVQKYARATQASVRITESDGELRFAVDDDGRGFDAAVAARGAGLTNMVDRIDALGGTIEIASAPGRGTSVRVALPVGA